MNAREFMEGLEETKNEMLRLGNIESGSDSLRFLHPEFTIIVARFSYPNDTIGIMLQNQDGKNLKSDRFTADYLTVMKEIFLLYYHAGLEHFSKKS